MNRAPFHPLVALLIPLGVAAQEPKLAVNGLDPVELCAGREVAGAQRLSVDRGRYRYRFASAASRATFEAAPDRYAIQLGGGCGRMGPLSGVGDPGRWAVHDGRIYIFASESCRTGFLADPARHLDRADPVPKGDGDAAARAERAIERAVAAIGGAERLDRLESLILIRDETRSAGGTAVRSGSAVFVRFPASIRREAWDGDWRRIDVVVGDAGFVHERTADGSSTYDHDASQVLAVRKAFQREPIAILRARHRADFVAFHRGDGEVSGHGVELVETAFDGATATLAIDSDDGRVWSVTYHGRAGATPLGDVVVTYGGFMDVRGFVLPTTRAVTYDGKPRGASTWTTVAVDQPLAEAYFERASLARERSVKPGINAQFLSQDLDVSQFVRRFEGESREIFTSRHRIANAIGIEAGESVADIGAGTGLFLRLFADAVGEDGRLFEVDISPRFVEHLRDRAKQQGLRQVEVVQCTGTSAELEDESVDVAFICDTYHHFEYPASTLESIHRALRPNGRLVVVDFERIPGESREFVLNHVRAGKDVFRAEIEAAGFEFAGEVEVPGLSENYLIRFEKR